MAEREERGRGEERGSNQTKRVRPYDGVRDVRIMLVALGGCSRRGVNRHPIVSEGVPQAENRGRESGDHIIGRAAGRYRRATSSSSRISTGIT